MVAAVIILTIQFFKTFAIQQKRIGSVGNVPYYHIFVSLSDWILLMLDFSVRSVYLKPNIVLKDFNNCCCAKVVTTLQWNYLCDFKICHSGQAPVAYFMTT